MLDAIDVLDYTKKHNNEIVPESISGIRMSRFNNAFAHMFNNYLKFHRISNVPRDMADDSKGIFFIKNGSHEIELNELSSGEKQVIYRSAFLLRDKGLTKGCPALIDEPEISMHPKWQEKIYGFIQNLFIESGVQQSQIFMATHSDHLLKCALDDDNALIITLKDGVPPKYTYKGDQGLILKNVTIAEIKWQIFDIPTTDFHDQLWAELSYDYVNKKVKKVTELDKELVIAAAGDLTCPQFLLI